MIRKVIDDYLFKIVLFRVSVCSSTWDVDSLLYGGLLGLLGLEPFSNGPVYPGALVFGACCWGNLSNGLELVDEGFFDLVLTGRINGGLLGVVSTVGFLLLEPARF